MDLQGEILTLEVIQQIWGQGFLTVWDLTAAPPPLGPSNAPLLQYVYNLLLLLDDGDTQTQRRDMNAMFGAKVDIRRLLLFLAGQQLNAQRIVCSKYLSCLSEGNVYYTKKFQGKSVVAAILRSGME